MSAFFTAITTSEGLVHVVTKSRWLGVLSMPHTSVVPQAPADLKRLGSFIKWSTTDASVLGMLHDAIAALVKKTGASGLVEIGKGASVHGWCPPFRSPTKSSCM